MASELLKKKRQIFLKRFKTVCVCMYVCVGLYVCMRGCVRQDGIFVLENPPGV